MASETLERLHREANADHPRTAGWYEAFRARWAAYKTYAAQIAAKLPFKWHPVGCDNPRQNHTGSSNGRDHIVLDEPFAQGRLRRHRGETLCKLRNTNNLWMESDGPTCKACLEIAERLIAESEMRQNTPQAH